MPDRDCDLINSQTLTVDHSVPQDFGMSVMNSLVSGQDPARDLRAELLAMLPQLRAFARMLSGNRNSAEELSRQTLTEAWRSRLAIGAEANLKTWLFAIARKNFCSNCCRELPEAPPKHVAANDNPDPATDQNWSADVPDTMHAVQFLPPLFREALILVSASGCSYEEAAEICDCPVGTIKSRVFRARRALAASFDMMLEI